jgi:hypothetical protein
VSKNFTADYAAYTELLAADSAGAYTPAGNITANSKIVIQLGNPTSTDVNLVASTTNLTAAGFSVNSLRHTLAWPNAIPNSLISNSYAQMVLFTTNSSGVRTNTGIPTSIAGLGAGVAPTWASNPGGLTVDGSMPTTSLYLFKTRKKGLKKINLTDGDANYSNTTASVPVCHGNNGDYSHFNDSRILGTSINERYNKVAYAAYASVAGTVTQNTDTDTVAESWGQYSAGNGSSVDPATGKPTRTVLADVPIQPLTSLGQFMHMKPYYFFQDHPALGSGSAYLNEPFGDMFVGGSVCPPNIPIGNTYGFRNSISVVADDSYLVNQVLFDSYFLSTVPPSTKPSGAIWPDNWDAFNYNNTSGNLTDLSKPFLNTRIVPNLSAGTIALSALRDKDKASASLLLNGAFNINSTSVAAWKALLYSLSGNDIRMWNATGQAYFNFTGLNCPIPRCWSATSNAAKNTPWCSMRDLSDAEATDLAKRIVEQVKTRGPFLSMADFLNRRLGAAGSLTRAGALQAAIDTTSPDINTKAKAVGEVTTTAFPPLQAWQPNNIKDALGTTWNTALGIPGYLMQQDLVQAFSPVMAARSDTFVVRTYGESINAATNKTESTAYCEAVVQRLPEYIDTADAAEIFPPTQTDNQTFGRRFKIVSFRWLSASDL